MYQLKRMPQEENWVALSFPGVEINLLHTDPQTGATAVLTRLAAGASIPRHRHTGADETVFVIQGDFIEDDQSYGAGAFFAGKAGSVHGPHRTSGGCLVLTQFSA